MKKLIKSKLILQVIVASMVATLATAGIVAATTTTIGANILTTGTVTGATLTDGTASLSTGALTGLTTALTAAQGGTGWGNITANTLLLGNGTGAIATTSAGTNGFVLGLSAGVPTWLATTTLTTITGTLPLTKGGTGAASAGAALTALGAAPSASPTFTGPVVFNGYATTTAQGIISPANFGAQPTACNSTLTGGMVWGVITQKLCICNGSAWIQATSTTGAACGF